MRLPVKFRRSSLLTKVVVLLVVVLSLIHIYCAGADCSACGGCQHTPMEELMALMKYMVGHNAAHAQELAGLAKQLEEAGAHSSYEQVMQAVSDFEKGNLRLSTVLTALEHERKG